MNHTDTSEPSESRVETARAVAGSGRERISKVVPHLRRGVDADAATKIVVGTALLGGLRALLSGKRKRGLATLTLGAAFLAATLGRRRLRNRGAGAGVEESDVVDTAPDVGAVADETGGGEDDHAAGDAAAEVTDTSPDIEDAASGLESESESDADSGSVDQREVVDTGVDTEDFAEESERETEEAADDRETEDETTGAEGADGAGV